jgi:hypothetical protein
MSRQAGGRGDAAIFHIHDITKVYHMGDNEVVFHPSDDFKDGVAVKARASER